MLAKTNSNAFIRNKGETRKKDNAEKGILFVTNPQGLLLLCESGSKELTDIFNEHIKNICKMKKYLIILALISACQMTFAENSVQEIFSRFSKMENATVVKLGTVPMALARLFTDTHGVKSLKVLELDECNEQTRQDFAKAIQELDTKKYEPLVSVNEKGEKVRILVNIEKDYIRELVILGCENTECYLVHLTGKIKPDDIQTVVNDNDK